MHQPAREPRPSIYYRYRVHDAWLPTAHPAPARAPVVIAGAGPAGMVTALELARHGVASVLLEAERQVSQGSRAIVFTRRSLEILQRLGALEAHLAKGLPWLGGRTFHGAEQILHFTMPHDELLELKRESLRIVQGHDITRTLETFEALYRGEEVVDPVDDLDIVAP